MRISLILTALILLLAVGFGWDQERRIRQVRAASARLEPALTKRGIPADSDKRKGGKARDRGETSRDIRGLATALVEAFKLDPKIRWQYEENELSERIEDLDRAGFEELLALLANDPDLQGREAKDLKGLVINKYAMLYPQAGLDFLVAHPDALEEGSGFKRSLILFAIVSWCARENADAVLKWYRVNLDHLSELKNPGTSSALVSLIAFQDPRQAFVVLDELGLGQDAAVRIFGSFRIEHGQEALDGFRKYSERIQDPKKREELWKNGLKALGAEVSNQGFDSAVQGFDAVNFSQEDMRVLAAEVTISPDKPAEAAKWIPWIAEHAGDQSAGPIRSFVSQWVTQDYPAASEWLAAMSPESPARNASIAAYAETVARYHPETAVGWAEQLPEGEARDGTLKAIYQSWPRKDDASKAAAEAFKTAHGIE